MTPRLSAKINGVIARAMASEPDSERFVDLDKACTGSTSF